METEGENTKRRVRVHRISEFAVYLGAFAVARGKTQTSAVWERERGERAVIGGVVSLPLFQRVQKGRRTGDEGEMEKGVASACREKLVKEILRPKLMNKDRCSILSLSD